jgi:hypothetical protein
MTAEGSQLASVADAARGAGSSATPEQAVIVDQPNTATQQPATSKYAHLPERVRREDLIEEQPAEHPHDPDGGRNPETDFMVRYSS